MRLPRLLICLPFLVLGCSSDPSKTNDEGGAGQGGGQTGGSGNAGGATTGGAGGNTTVGQGGSLASGSAIGGTTGSATGGSATGGATTGGTSTQNALTQCPAPIDIGVRIVGRYDGCATDGVRIRWSGTGFVGAFTGTGVSVRLLEPYQANQYSVLIDDVLGSTLVTNPGKGTYVLGTNLTAGAHVVQLYRRTEASFGVTTVLGVEVEGGKLETPPAAPTRFLEVVGDSISCGYGNEGLTATCSFSAATENHYLSYGSLLARKFNAELSTVAWSGKGVVSNYNGDTVLDRMPQYYESAVPGDAKTAWNFNVKPQAVIVNLGTNDYSTNNDPADTDFVSTYAALLSTIRGHYPDAYILCTIGPMLSDPDLTTVRKNIVAAVAKRGAVGDNNVEAYEMKASNPSPGCDYHPNLTTHQSIADELAVKIQAKLGW